jgi:hypothetical protein
MVLYGALHQDVQPVAALLFQSLRRDTFRDLLGVVIRWVPEVSPLSCCLRAPQVPKEDLGIA